MPRIHTKKKEYMIGDLPGWIIGRMYTKGLKQKDLAELLGITPKAFSARLHKDRKDARQKQGMSQKDLAEAIGVTTRALIYWENGQRKISLECADKIFKVLHMSVQIGELREQVQAVDHIIL